MKPVELTAYPRELKRRAGTRRVRAAKRIPAVIYGRETKAQSLEVDKKAFEHVIHHSVSETRLVDLTIEGDGRAKRLALLQEVQHHPLDGHVLHVDFHEVSENESVTAIIPIETLGESVGVKMGGGTLEHVLFKVRVKCLPKDLPEFIQVNVENMNVGETIHLGEVPLPDGVEVMGDKNIPVVSIAAPRTGGESAEEAGEAAGGGEVEMIKEKKEEGGEAKPKETKAKEAKK